MLRQVLFLPVFHRNQLNMHWKCQETEFNATKMYQSNLATVPCKDKCRVKIFFIFKLRSHPLWLWIQHNLVKTCLSIFSSLTLLGPALLLHTRGAAKEHGTWRTSDFVILRLDLSLDTRRRFLVMLGLTNTGTLLWLTLNPRAVLHSYSVHRKEREVPSSAGAFIFWIRLPDERVLRISHIFSFPKPYIHFLFP